MTQLITTTDALNAFRERLRGAPFVTVDTEFLREKTYYPQLCLVQVGGPDEAAAIDPLAPGIDLSALFDLMDDVATLKVFHAARQDVEIFLHLTGRIPTPIFDTQIAAMVCGFGESVSYEQLAGRLAGVRIDKSSRFTDWSARPLTDRQVVYALSDVIHLRPVYEKLERRITKSGRDPWLAEEVAILADPGTYRVDPDQAWRRFRLRSSEKPRFLAVLKELAAWREREAQRKDLPRNRVLRDEALLEIAAHAPSEVDDLARTRGFGRSAAEGRYGQEILQAVERGLAMLPDDVPRPDTRPEPPGGIGPTVELLKVLLKLVCDEAEVAAKLVASSADLEAIASSDDADVPAMHGWRRELFGERAVGLKTGRTALAIRGRRVVAVDLS
jgi:ribonuclease D